MPQKNKQSTLIDFLKIFLVPTILNKILMLYFGLNYSMEPGEGYGYGLFATALFFFVTAAIFLWKYKGVEDP